MDLSLAIKKTQVYARYFHFPLTVRDTYYWLISSQTVPQKKISSLVSPLSPVDQKLKNRLNQVTAQKTQSAAKIIKLTRFFPGILFIGLTGSVAAQNSRPDDDLDLLIITAPHTLWFTRFFFLLALSVFFKRRHPGDSKTNTRDIFCPNLWLDTTSLAVPGERRNVYTAHEVLQVKPILDRGTVFQSLIRQNCWTAEYLANAYQEIAQSTPSLPSKSPYFLFAPLNLIFFLVQYLYMLPKKTTEKVTLHSAYFHKNNPSTTLTKMLFSLK